jgi:hypothetical protein
MTRRHDRHTACLRVNLKDHTCEITHSTSDLDETVQFNP